MGKPKWLEPLEQVGHFWIGLGCSLIFADVLYWRRERVKQWPPATEKYPVMFIERFENGGIACSVKRESLRDEAYFASSRVIDMMTDMHAYIVGTTVGSVVKCVLAGLLGYWIHGKV